MKTNENTVTVAQNVLAQIDALPTTTETTEAKEKKEKKSISKFMAEEIALIEEAFDFAGKLKQLNGRRAILVEYGANTDKIDAEIAGLKPNLSDEDYLRIGKKFALYFLDTK